MALAIRPLAVVGILAFVMTLSGCGNSDSGALRDDYKDSTLESVKAPKKRELDECQLATKVIGQYVPGAASESIAQSDSAQGCKWTAGTKTEILILASNPDGFTTMAQDQAEFPSNSAEWQEIPELAPGAWSKVDYTGKVDVNWTTDTYAMRITSSHISQDATVAIAKAANTDIETLS